MKMPPEILTQLLKGAHLSVEDRKLKGLWPNETLQYSEVLAHLVSLIQQEEWFPRQMPIHQQGDLVYEGTVIQKISPNRYVCHSRRPSVYGLCTIAEKSKREFSNAKDAAEFYLKWELNLPGTLDSWPVV